MTFAISGPFSIGVRAEGFTSAAIVSASAYGTLTSSVPAVSWTTTVPTIPLIIGTPGSHDLKQYTTGFNPAIHEMRIWGGPTPPASAPLPAGVTLQATGSLVFDGSASVSATGIIVEIVELAPRLESYLYPQDGVVGANRFAASVYGGQQVTTSPAGAVALPYQWAWGWKYIDQWDWKDANGFEQGSAQFAQVPYSTADAAGKVYAFSNTQLTTLVEQWRNGARPNRGFIVRVLPTSGTVYCYSRQHTAPALRPQLVMQLSGGGQVIREAIADAHLTTGTGNSQGNLVSLEIGTAAVIFDVSGISAAITAVTVNLYCLQAFSNGQLQLYAADLSHLELPAATQTGIAQAFVKDIGLEAHPQVYVCERFVDANGQARKWQFGWDAPPAVSNPAKTIVGATDPLFPAYTPRAPGLNACRITLRNVGNGGDVNLWPFWANRLTNPSGINNPTGEPEHVHIRYSLRLAEDWDPSQNPGGGKFLFGFDSRYLRGLSEAPYVKPGAPGYAGNGGQPSQSGCTGFSIRGGYDPAIPSGAARLCDDGFRPLRFYSYFPDFHRIGFSPHGMSGPYFGMHSFFKKGVWYDIEMYMKLNTIDTSGATLAFFGDTIQSMWTAQDGTFLYGSTADPKIGTDTVINSAPHVFYGNVTGYLYPSLTYAGPKIVATNGSQNVTDTAIVQSPGVGRHDGEVKVWIDDRLSMSWTNALMRHIASVQIQRIWGNQYAGGTPWEDNDITCHISNVVIADAYIGPVRTS